LSRIRYVNIPEERKFQILCSSLASVLQSRSESNNVTYFLYEKKKLCISTKLINPFAAMGYACNRWLRMSTYAPRGVRMIHDSLGLVSLWLEGWPSLNQPPQSCSPLARAVKWQIHLRVTGVITCVICTVRLKNITHETFTYLNYSHVVYQERLASSKLSYAPVRIFACKPIILNEEF
jgi:hypothetical protein